MYHISTRRRFGSTWETRNNYRVDDVDDSQQYWLAEFVKLIGGDVEKAKELTQDARQRAYARALEIVEKLRRNESVPAYKGWNEW